MKIKRFEDNPHFFNEPWMRNIEPELLYRYWERKNTRSPLVEFIENVGIMHIRTDFGVLTRVIKPTDEKSSAIKVW